MASGGDIKAAFAKFATKANGNECTSKDLTRWLTDAGGILGKNCSSNNLDICMAKVKTKGKSTLTCAQMDALIAELAKSYCKDHKCTEDEAKTQLREKLSAASPKAHGATKTSKTGGVAKMTDTSQYTGAHKERFGQDGKGKGAEGRTDKVENTGYVGNYKGKDTYDKTKK